MFLEVTSWQEENNRHCYFSKLLRKSKQTYHYFVDYILFDFFPMDPIVLAKLRYELWCICSVYNSSSRKIIQKFFLAKYNVLLSNLLIIR